jgi:hypothetical protein
MANTIKITLELHSLAQVEAIQAALEVSVDMESDRAKHDAADFGPRDKARLTAARQVLAMLTSSQEGK